MPRPDLNGTQAMAPGLVSTLSCLRGLEGTTRVNQVSMFKKNAGNLIF